MKKFLVISFALTFSLTLVSGQKKPAFDLKASVARGSEVYVAQCISCHMEAGDGVEGVYPPLAKSDFLKTDKKKIAVLVIQGITGPITVNGKSYDGEMNGFSMTDQEVSDVVNYIRNAWGNKGEAMLPEEVKAVR